MNEISLERDTYTASIHPIAGIDGISACIKFAWI